MDCFCYFFQIWIPVIKFCFGLLQKKLISRIQKSWINWCPVSQSVWHAKEPSMAMSAEYRSKFDVLHRWRLNMNQIFNKKQTRYIECGEYWSNLGQHLWFWVRLNGILKFLLSILLKKNTEFQNLTEVFKRYILLTLVSDIWWLL